MQVPGRVYALRPCRKPVWTQRHIPQKHRCQGRVSEERWPVLLCELKYQIRTCCAQWSEASSHICDCRWGLRQRHRQKSRQIQLIFHGLCSWEASSLSKQGLQQPLKRMDIF